MPLFIASGPSMLWGVIETCRHLVCLGSVGGCNGHTLATEIDSHYFTLKDWTSKRVKSLSLILTLKYVTNLTQFAQN